MRRIFPSAGKSVPAKLRNTSAAYRRFFPPTFTYSVLLRLDALARRLALRR